MIALIFIGSCEEPDTTVPLVSIIFPESDSHISEIVTISGIATDNVGVQSVELWVDGEKEGLADSTEPYSFQLNTIQYTNSSTHVLTLLAQDASNNIGISDPVTVIVDHSASYPNQVNVISVSYNTEGMTIIWEKSSDTDFDRYELYSSEGNSNFELLSTIYNQDSTTFSFTEFDPQVVYNFRVTIFDTLGFYSVGSPHSNIPRLAPNSVDVTHVDYTLSIMTISWQVYESDPLRIAKLLSKFNKTSTTFDGTDFISYELMFSETSDGEKTLLASFTNIEDTTFTISEFDPTHENWFWVVVTDFWGLTSLGLGKSNPVDQAPMMSFLNPLQIVGDSCITTWQPNNEEDFTSYQLYESTNEDMVESSLIYTTGIASENSHTISGLVWDQNRYFEVITTDYWGQTSASNIESYYYSTIFQKIFGGTNRDVASTVQQTEDGGFIFLGETESQGFGDSDFWLVKTDFHGDREWDRTFGGSDQDVARSGKQTSDGGFILAGYTQSSGAGAQDVWLIKTDVNGNQEWEKTFGGGGSDVAYSIQQTDDGGYIIAGYTSSFGSGSTDVWLIKTDALGEEEWSRTFGGTESDEARSVQQTDDGGYILIGTTRSFSDWYSDLWLVKTDANGIEEWNYTFGGNISDVGKSVKQTSDGGFILAGYTQSYGEGTDFDLYLIKTDPYGQGVWSKLFGGSEGDFGQSVIQTEDGGYIITGSTNSFGDSSGDVWLVKTDAEGIEEWTNTAGGNSSDAGYCIQQTSDGYYIIVGHTTAPGESEPRVLLIRADPNGNTGVYGE